MWSQKKITKIIRCGNKVQSKFDLNFMMYRYYISRNKESTITITDVDFPSFNPNDLLTIVTHFQDHQWSETSFGSYNTARNFLEDYIVEFFKSGIEFSHLFGTESILEKITTELPKA